MFSPCLCVPCTGTQISRIFLVFLSLWSPVPPAPASVRLCPVDIRSPRRRGLGCRGLRFWVEVLYAIQWLASRSTLPVPRSRARGFRHLAPGSPGTWGRAVWRRLNNCLTQPCQAYPGLLRHTQLYPGILYQHTQLYSVKPRDIQVDTQKQIQADSAISSLTWSKPHIASYTLGFKPALNQGILGDV